jgi:ferric iron reductase protein FhuF
VSLTSVWLRASAFTEPAGAPLSALVARPQREWGAAPHAAAALAWKAYSWWLLDPVVRALMADRPVPVPGLHDTEVAMLDTSPYIAFRPAGSASVTPGSGYDVLARVASEVLEGHLHPVARALSAATRVGARTLWGSVAEAVSYPVLAAGRPELARRLLVAWSLDELIDLVDPLMDPTTSAAQPLRRTCCLAVTVPGLGVCETCPVARRRLTEAAASTRACSI